MRDRFRSSLALHEGVFNPAAGPVTIPHKGKLEQPDHLYFRLQIRTKAKYEMLFEL